MNKELSSPEVVTFSTLALGTLLCLLVGLDEAVEVEEHILGLGRQTDVRWTLGNLA